MILTEDIIRKAAKESYKLDGLNNLINGELVAHWQYEVAAKTCIGNNQSYLVKQFEEHAKEEYEHYEKLMVAFLARGGKPELNLINIINTASPTTIEMECNTSDYYRWFFHQAEESAIKAYESYLEELGDSDQDLADIISGIIADERDHDLDMERLIVEGNPNVVTPKVDMRKVSIEDIKKDVSFTEKVLGY